MSAVATMPPPLSPSPDSICSDRRAAANRANARKSTGPRTPAGKARSALNAVKTGCFARTPLLPGEDEAERRAFVIAIVEDLSPATPIEQGLAKRVATLSWRRRRIGRAEAEVIGRAFGSGRQERADYAQQDRRNADRRKSRLAGKFLAEQFAGREPGPLARLADHDRRLCGSIDASLRMLMRVRDNRERGESPALNEPILSGERPLLAPARRAKFPSRSRVARAAPNKANGVPRDMQPSGVAPNGSASNPRSSPMPNEPTVGPACPAPSHLASAQIKAIAAQANPLLTAARRTGRLPESSAAQNKPIADAAGGKTRPTNEPTVGPIRPPDSHVASAPIEPITATGGRHAGGVNWIAITAAAANAVAARPGRDERTHRAATGSIALRRSVLGVGLKT